MLDHLDGIHEALLLQVDEFRETCHKGVMSEAFRHHSDDRRRSSMQKRTFREVVELFAVTEFERLESRALSDSCNSDKSMPEALGDHSDDRRRDLLSGRDWRFIGFIMSPLRSREVSDFSCPVP